MMPVLTLLYILMALGATALTKIWFLRPALIKQLIYRNGLICSIMLGCYACSSLLTYSPSTKTETISRLHQWNIIRTTKKNISLLIMESELAYPIADNAQTREACTIRYNGAQNAQSNTTENLSDATFHFLPIKSLLCKQGIIINLPEALPEKYFQEKKDNGNRVASQNLFASLKGKISIQYTPAWQFRPWIETFFGHLAKRL
ncbi:MAG: hypothetical protein GY868_15300 [Deltaproteobacteria bacterium]|nr:hypothetical protein [Deltaproteobacteria bacterium]